MPSSLPSDTSEKHIVASPCVLPLWTQRATTALISGWGVLFACFLFRSLLVWRSGALFFAAFISLVIIWASLERKRWGRQALLGLSAVMLTAACAQLALVGLSARHLMAAPLAPHLRAALQHWIPCARPALPGAIVSALTLAWLLWKPIRAEYETNKRRSLAIAQPAIAAVLVTAWTLSAFLGPNMPEPEAGEGITLIAVQEDTPISTATHASPPSGKCNKSHF